MAIEIPNKIFTTEKATELAAQLNADSDDNWTYGVILNPQNEARAIIAIYDEDGEFVAYL